MRKKTKGIIFEKFLDQDILEEDDFFMAEEVEGYDKCYGANRQKCLTDCSFPIIVPTIVTLN